MDIDCGSYTKAGVDDVGRWVAARFAELGAAVEVRPHDTFGDTVIGTFEGAEPDGPTVLCIGHMDTVFDAGTAAERPFSVDDIGIARGPGVTDMKGGLLSGLYAIAALRAASAGCRWDGSTTSPIRTRRSARRRRRRTSCRWRRRPTSHWCSSARVRTATSSRRARGSCR